MKVMKNDPEMLEEYDFSHGIRGKYAERYKEGTNVVILEPELIKYFPDSESVNEVLKSLVDVLKRREDKIARQVK